MNFKDLDQNAAFSTQSMTRRFGLAEEGRLRLSNLGRLFRWPDAKIVALADQSIVSGTSFLTSLLIGRFAGASQLGLYAIGVTVLASIFTIHGALLAQPYAVHRHRPTGTPAEHASATLVLCGLLSVANSLLLITLSLALWAGRAWLDFIPALIVFALILPSAVSRDFLRRFAYARLQVTHVLRLDLTVAVLQLLTLVWFCYHGTLSTVAAFGAIGLACGVATILFLYEIRSELVIRIDQLRSTWQRSWTIGKWLVVAQVMIQIQGFATYWICLAIAGAGATGVYAACMTIVSVANPLVNGLGNLLLPKLVLAWKEQGATGLRRRAIQDSILLGAVMAPLCAGTLVFGDELLHLLYPAPEYMGHGQTTAVLAFAILAFSVGMPASYALTGMERPRSVLIVSTVGALVTIALVFGLTTKFGILGAAYGWLLGNVVVAAGLWFELLASVSRLLKKSLAGGN